MIKIKIINKRREGEQGEDICCYKSGIKEEG
jgi:hypothetical protein